MHTEQHSNEDFLSNIIAKMPGHVYWKNKEGAIIGCNIAQAQSLGFAKAKKMLLDYCGRE